MAQSFLVYTGDGETVSFGTPAYIARDHISVKVNGESILSGWSWSGENQITFTSPPGDGDIVTILRQSSPSARLVDYTNSSVLSEDVLDTDSLQAFYLAQEAGDQASRALRPSDVTGNWDGEGRVLSELAPGVASTDAVTVGQIAPYVADAASYAGLAAMSAGSAANAATTALGHASAASASAGEAEAYAEAVLTAMPNRTVDTVADLILAPIGPSYSRHVLVRGYHQPNDDGGGIFDWVEGDSSTADGGFILESSFVGANGRWIRRPLPYVTPEMFGAKGDGSTDDSAAFIAVQRALPDRNGFDVLLGAKTYKINNTPIYLTRRIVFIGVNRESTFLDFSEATEVVNAPYSAHIVSVHSNNIAGTSSRATPIVLPAGTVGTYGQNSGLKHLAVLCNPDIPDGIGVFANVAMDCENILIRNANLHCFCAAALATDLSTRDGAAGPSGVDIGGNSNNGHYRSIWARGARNGDGIHVSGANANSNLFDRSDTVLCKGWGVNDASSHGNTYNQPHTAANDYGAYRVRPASTNRSLFLNPYAEGAQGGDNGGIMYELNSRAMIIGADGITPQTTGPDANATTGTPALNAHLDGIVSLRPLVVMDNPSARTNGDAYARLQAGTIDMRTSSGRIQRIAAYSSAYTGYFNGTLAGDAWVLLANASSGAITTDRPYFVNGLALSDAHAQTAANAEPTSGTYARGSIVWNNSPSAGGVLGWVCVVGGTAGSTAQFAEIRLGAAEAQADSVATDVAGLVTDFNALLAKLRTAGLLAT